jgi:hypothetical protein
MRLLRIRTILAHLGNLPLLMLSSPSEGRAGEAHGHLQSELLGSRHALPRGSSCELSTRIWEDCNKRLVPSGY